MALFEILGLCLLGGLILNLTPCVFPVIGLKLASFRKLGAGDRWHGFKHGAVYALGIIVSFIILAFIAIGIKMSGGMVLFGFQMQSKAFLACMTLLLGGLTVHSLKPDIWRISYQKVKGWVSGLFKSEKSSEGLQNSPSSYKTGFFSKTQWKIQDWLESVKAHTPLAGSFCYGLLTTLLGSSCVGPFLGGAMGVAMSSSPLLILLAFTAVGVGMAVPYLFLSLVKTGNVEKKKSTRWRWVPKVVKWTSTILLGLSTAWFAFLWLL